MSQLCRYCCKNILSILSRNIDSRSARTRNNDSKKPAPRFDRYKFLFHRACLATFATQSAITGREQMQQNPLLNHLVGGGDERRWYGEAEHPGDRGVDDEFELARLHDWQLRRLRAFEYAAGIYA
jgi:hypothetical protein